MKSHYRQFREIYYCASFLTFSISFLVFFWDLPSFLLRFSLAELVGILSYQLSFSLLESLIVAMVILLIVYLLPIREVKEHRSAAGVIFLVFFAIGALLFKARREILGWLSVSPLLSGPAAGQVFVLLLMVTTIGLPLISIYFLRNEKFTAQIRSFTEHLFTLSNSYTLLGIVGIIIILYRNLS